MGASKVKKTTLAPCREACPAGIDVPRYIRHIREKRFDEALAVIREKIPFPAVCGHACVHPCETKCARVQYDDAISIRLLKRAAEEMSKGVIREGKPKPTGKKIAIIGSGPCGLTAAYYLAGLGHGVTVFETLPQAGGMLRYGIPEYRLPNDVVDREIAAIKARGVKIKMGSSVASAQGLLKKGYDAVLAASGAWKPVKMGIPGEDSSMVLDGVAFLRDVNSGMKPAIGKKVIVVGGGNTAVDAARASIRLGAKTTLVYRRNRADMPASPEEIAEAEEEGVQIEFMTAPVQIAKGKATCIRFAAGPLDESGRPRPVPIEGSEFAIPCSTVIMAVGQTADADALKLEGNKNGTARVNASLATSSKGIFAAGDAVSGPKTIIDAIAQGRKASETIDRYLGGKGKIDRDVLQKVSDELPETMPMGTRRTETAKAAVKGRIQGFTLVEAGYDEEAACREAMRCLACDIRQYKVEVNSAICKDCDYCKEMCHMGIFGTAETFNAIGYKPSVVISSDRCVGCLKCLYVCPDLAIKITEGR
ncbi:MAG: FAD-dependent oxidoreductase [Syntrophales bacterium]|nr:FAD-dependent oxidoreductase [Syntrophales bacterium]